MLSAHSPTTRTVAGNSQSTDQLNAVQISKHQLEAALRSLATLPPADRSNPAAQAMLLQAFVEREEIDGGVLASAALRARIVALNKWTRDHDPQKQSNADAVIEAAARHPLVDKEKGVAFDTVSFSELVLFVEELPF